MLKSLGENADPRKLRLFACACVRRVGDSLTDESRRAVEVAEAYADGQAAHADLWDARKAAGEAARTAAEAEGAAAEAAWVAAEAARTAQEEGEEREERTAAEAAEAARAAETARAAWAAAGAAARAARTAREEGEERAAAGAATGAAAWAAEAAGAELTAAWAAERRTQANLVRCIFINPFRPAPVLGPEVLAWSGGVVVKLAEAVYEERAFDRMAVLADALEEAGLSDAAILNHCRRDQRHARGCWVLDLLMGDPTPPGPCRNAGQGRT